MPPELAEAYLYKMIDRVPLPFLALSTLMKMFNNIIDTTFSMLIAVYFLLILHYI